jgi:hypothetical protein
MEHTTLLSSYYSFKKVCIDTPYYKSHNVIKVFVTDSEASPTHIIKILNKYLYDDITNIIVQYIGIDIHKYTLDQLIGSFRKNKNINFYLIYHTIVSFLIKNDFILFLSKDIAPFKRYRYNAYIKFHKSHAYILSYSIYKYDPWISKHNNDDEFHRFLIKTYPDSKILEILKEHRI